MIEKSKSKTIKDYSRSCNHELEKCQKHRLGAVRSLEFNNLVGHETPDPLPSPGVWWSSQQQQQKAADRVSEFRHRRKMNGENKNKLRSQKVKPRLWPHSRISINKTLHSTGLKAPVTFDLHGIGLKPVFLCFSLAPAVETNASTGQEYTASQFVACVWANAWKNIVI